MCMFTWRSRQSAGTLNSTLSSCVSELIPESDSTMQIDNLSTQHKTQGETQTSVAAAASSNVPENRWELQVQCLCSNLPHLAVYRWAGYKGSSKQQNLILLCAIIEGCISQNPSNLALSFLLPLLLWAKHWRCFSEWASFFFVDIFVIFKYLGSN